MTRREYGKWPGWEVWAGWDESKGGYWYCSICKFDGEWETEIFIEEDMRIRPQDVTPRLIEWWLTQWAKRYPEVIPPPGFIRHLWSDKGVCGGNPTVKYEPR
jgi:hypothetical protein